MACAHWRPQDKVSESSQANFYPLVWCRCLLHLASYSGGQEPRWMQWLWIRATLHSSTWLSFFEELSEYPLGVATTIHQVTCTIKYKFDVVTMFVSRANLTMHCEVALMLVLILSHAFSQYSPSNMCPKTQICLAHRSNNAHYQTTKMSWEFPTTNYFSRGSSW